MRQALNGAISRVRVRSRLDAVEHQIGELMGAEAPQRSIIKEFDSLRGRFVHNPTTHEEGQLSTPALQARFTVVMRLLHVDLGLPTPSASDDE